MHDDDTDELPLKRIIVVPKAELARLRYEIAKDTYAQVLAIEYATTCAMAEQDEDPYGTREPGEPRKLEIRIDLRGPAEMSAAAADCLLEALGFTARETEVS